MRYREDFMPGVGLLNIFDVGRSLGPDPLGPHLPTLHDGLSTNTFLAKAVSSTTIQLLGRLLICLEVVLPKSKR